MFAVVLSPWPILFTLPLITYSKPKAKYGGYKVDCHISLTSVFWISIFRD
jgi:hypothetical protein